MADQTVKVALRVRPLVKWEMKSGFTNIIQKTPSQPQVVVNCGKKDEPFTFNYAFAQEDTQEMVYENAVKSMVYKLFEGYNVTILAYGQTGSGKTHTMGTTYDGIDNDDIGVIPRAVSDIFDHIDQMPDYNFTVQCAFLELYQEKLYDLLSSQPRDQRVVDIREMQNNIIIPNLTEVPVNSMQETIDCLRRGAEDRAVGSTAMNKVSSRSHAIFTITLQKVHKENATAATSAKFHLVDLAGSERSKKTKAEGEQFKEGVKINQGLFVLGNVISALGDPPKNGQHIPYRNSKLTRLLQDSLGGNSMTLMIACVSPADYNMEETLNTLNYANRAKNIKNKPIVNQDPKTAEINRLKALVDGLQLKLSSKSGVGEAVVGICQECDAPPTKSQLKAQLHVITTQLQANLIENADRENVFHEFEDKLESLHHQIKEAKLDRNLETDMSASELYAYKENMRTLINTVLQLYTHMAERNECILEDSKSLDTVAEVNGSRQSLDEHEDELNLKRDIFIKKQTEHNVNLKTIKDQLAVKEELQKKILNTHTNFQTFCDGEQVDASKAIELTETIAQLEREKKELEGMLRSKSVASKLAEERRKRVNHLEEEIAKMRTKETQMQKLLKERAGLGLKLEKQNSEIREMKQKKVQLIRQMKSESEEFRRWRLAREKELAQLRSNDQKMKSEVARKDQLHEKQRNVLKRKVDEANAACKRYKAALEKQKNSKAAKSKNGAGALNKSMGWINEELEVITSIVDMKQSLQQLFEVRSVLSERLRALKREKPPNKDQIKVVEDEIDMHNAQIKDLTSKINENDLDAKSKQMYEGISNLPESRSIVKHLLNNVIEQRSHMNQYFTQVRDQKGLLETTKERMQQLEETLQAKTDEMRRECDRMEADHQEQMAVLLKALTTKDSESQAVSILEKALEEKVKENEELRQSLASKKRTTSTQRQNSLRDSMQIDLFSDDEDGNNGDDPTDPDYRATPLHKRGKTLLQKAIVAAADATFDRPKSTRLAKSKQHCQCKRNCIGSCGCYKKQNGCSENCLCKSKCSNTFNKNFDGLKRSVSMESQNSDTDKENCDEDNVQTPKKKRIENDDIHPYVYSVKKRNPVFQTD